mgnify:CR=1 FL=1
MRRSNDVFLSIRAQGFDACSICAIRDGENGRPTIAKKKQILKSTKAMKRLNTLKSVYGTPQRLRSKLGLRRKSLSPSQKFLRLFAR